MTEKETLGLIGVGLLGTALAGRLAAAGYKLVGYDPAKAAHERLRAVGGRVASSLEDVAGQCGKILLSLPGPPQVAETIDRLEPLLRAGMVILDTTTGDPEMAADTARRLQSLGVAYMDCEVGGSSQQTAAGESILICGADESAFVQCADIFAAISATVFHTGPPGTGTRMKLTLNIAIGLHRAVLAECITFAKANGIAPAMALKILKNSPAYSKAMDVKGEKMLRWDFAPEARLAQHLKDVRLILETGEKVGARLPLSRVHEALLSEAVEQGFGAEDNSAIIKLFGGKS